MIINIKSNFIYYKLKSCIYYYLNYKYNSKMTLSSNSSFINELINISNEYVDSYMDDSSLNAPTSILKKKNLIYRKSS